MKTFQLTLDDETARVLDRLAKGRRGGRSMVVRAALWRMAEQDRFEDYLDWLERQPDIRRSMMRALADERAGRTVDHNQVVKRFAKCRRD